MLIAQIALVAGDRLRVGLAGPVAGPVVLGPPGFVAGGVAAVQEERDRAAAGGTLRRHDFGSHLHRDVESGQFHRVQVVLAADRAVRARLPGVDSAGRKRGRRLCGGEGVPIVLTRGRVQPPSGGQHLKVRQPSCGGLAQVQPERPAVLRGRRHPEQPVPGTELDARIPHGHGLRRTPDQLTLAALPAEPPARRQPAVVRRAQRPFRGRLLGLCQSGRSRQGRQHRHGGHTYSPGTSQWSPPQNPLRGRPVGIGSLARHRGRMGVSVGCL